jgi:RNA polymerase sigma factor (sigma-70 family)
MRHLSDGQAIARCEFCVALRKSNEICLPGGYYLMADTPSDSATRASLLVRLRDARDAESWQTFVDTYAPLVYGYCLKRGVQDADAADVLQEVMARVARAMRTFEYQPERGRFRDWLGTVTRHTLIKFLDREQRQTRGAGGDVGVNCLDDLVAPEADTEWTAEFNAQVLRVALERLRPVFEPPTWRAFERTWLDNRPALETSHELDLPIEKVYAAKARVLKRLREEVLLLADCLPPTVGS